MFYRPRRAPPLHIAHIFGVKGFSTNSHHTRTTTLINNPNGSRDRSFCHTVVAEYQNGELMCEFPAHVLSPMLRSVTTRSVVCVQIQGPRSSDLSPGPETLNPESKLVSRASSAGLRDGMLTGILQEFDVPVKIENV